MAELFAQAERSAAAGKALYARKVAESGAYGASGHRDAAGWLADVSGEPRGRAREVLATAEVVRRVPEVHRAFSSGSLSGAQAKVIGEAAALDPAATTELLRAAREESFAKVAALANRTVRRARSEEDLEREEARVHSGRYCRAFSPREGGVRLEAWLTKRAGARVLARLDQVTAAIFSETSGSENPEPGERYRADALVELVCGSRPRRSPGRRVGKRVKQRSDSAGAPGFASRVSGEGGGEGCGEGGGEGCGEGEGEGEGGEGGEGEPVLTEAGDRRPGLGRSGPGAHVVVRVDVGALRRGWLEGAEVCEIPGVGPIPVATAREILGDAFFTIVVTEGVDVRCVTGTKRTIPTPLRVALSERDPMCVVPGCGVAHYLEIDHWQRDYSMDGPTRLDNLARLCGRHHAMKTYTGWRLSGGPGHWKWVPPKIPRAGPARDGPQRSSGGGRPGSADPPRRE
ncbi:MAG: HNH endonuclease signature motif containing protein [Acidimicrobiales bacterium]